MSSVRNIMDPEVRSRGRGIEFDPAEGKTMQEFKDQSDINNMIRRMENMGLDTPWTQAPEPTYGDFTSASDFKESLDNIMAIQESFYALPKNIRDLSGNSPQGFMEALEDPEFRQIVAEEMEGFFPAVTNPVEPPPSQPPAAPEGGTPPAAPPAPSAPANGASEGS